MTAAPTAYSRVSEPPVDGETELVAADQQDPGDRRQRRADDEAGQPDPEDVDAGAPSRLGVAADGVDVAAPCGPGQQRGEHHQEDHQHHDDDRDTLERGDAGLRLRSLLR